MYDRLTNSLWNQFTGGADNRAVVGVGGDAGFLSGAGDDVGGVGGASSRYDGFGHRDGLVSGVVVQVVRITGSLSTMTIVNDPEHDVSGCRGPGRQAGN